MNSFFTVFIKIAGVAFKKMWLVGANNKNITGRKWLHIIARHQRALAADYPGNLYFMMAVQMLIKMRQVIFLHMNTFVFCNRYCKLNYFHFTNINDISFL